MTHGQPANLPSLVAHADWSINAPGRQFACATLRDGTYSAAAPEDVGDSWTFLPRLAERSLNGRVLVGFDFPIGLPATYARKAGTTDFIRWLAGVSDEDWNTFSCVARSSDEISLRRPFYPHKPGGTRQQHLLDGLEVENVDSLRRSCEMRLDLAHAASPIFWTLGAKQVGRAALNGWNTILRPSLQRSDVDIAVWPFAGSLPDLLSRHSVVVVETYPTAFYRLLGVEWLPSEAGAKRGKASQEGRKGNAGPLLRWAERAGVTVQDDLVASVADGFGADRNGEDRFDAVIGLFGMLDVLLGRRSIYEPTDFVDRNVEGWILGRTPLKSEAI